jgi:16S rRNA (guanine1207-N2)-methyltransferase
MENVPRGIFHLKEGLPRPPDEPYDAIVTNPPFHRGKAEDPGLILDLIEGSPRALSKRGRLVLVAQRRLPVEGAFRAAFREVSLLADEGGFRVWDGRLPRHPTG